MCNMALWSNARKYLNCLLDYLIIQHSTTHVISKFIQPLLIIISKVILFYVDTHTNFISNVDLSMLHTANLIYIYIRVRHTPHYTLAIRSRKSSSKGNNNIYLHVGVAICSLIVGRAISVIYILSLSSRTVSLSSFNLARVHVQCSSLLNEIYQGFKTSRLRSTGEII